MDFLKLLYNYLFKNKFIVSTMKKQQIGVVSDVKFFRDCSGGPLSNVIALWVKDDCNYGSINNQNFWLKINDDKLHKIKILEVKKIIYHPEQPTPQPDWYELTIKIRF